MNSINGFGFSFYWDFLAKNIRKSSCPLFCLCILSSVMLCSCVGIQSNGLGYNNQGRRAAESYYFKGCNTWDNNHALAIKYWEKSIEADPSYKKPVKILAGAYFAPLIANERNAQIKAEYLKKSRFYANDLIEMDKNDADGYFIMAQAFVSDQLSKEAIPYYKQLLNFNTQQDSVYYKKIIDKNDINYSLALCYGALRDYKNTLFYLKKFVSECSGSQCYSESLSSAKELIPKLESYFRNLKKIESTREISLPEKSIPKAVPLKRTHQPEVKPSDKKIPSPPAQLTSTPRETLALKVEEQREEIDKTLDANFDRIIFMATSKKDL